MTAELKYFAYTKCRDGTTVSTIFIPANIAFSSPAYFDTAIISADGVMLTEHCQSETDALKRHKMHVDSHGGRAGFFTRLLNL